MKDSIFFVYFWYVLWKCVLFVPSSSFLQSVQGSRGLVMIKSQEVLSQEGKGRVKKNRESTFGEIKFYLDEIWSLSTDFRCTWADTRKVLQVGTLPQRVTQAAEAIPKCV